jgi:IS6 family transposase
MLCIDQPVRLQGHMDETYVRINGFWCYLSHAVDQCGRLIDFRLIAQKYANAARTFMRQTSEIVR